MKLYSQLCKTMLEKYEQTDFGPTAVNEPTKSMDQRRVQGAQKERR